FRQVRVRVGEIVIDQPVEPVYGPIQLLLQGDRVATHPIRQNPGSRKRLETRSSTGSDRGRRIVRQLKRQSVEKTASLHRTCWWQWEILNCRTGEVVRLAIGLTARSVTCVDSSPSALALVVAVLFEPEASGRGVEHAEQT